MGNRKVNIDSEEVKTRANNLGIPLSEAKHQLVIERFIEKLETPHVSATLAPVLIEQFIEDLRPPHSVETLAETLVDLLKYLYQTGKI